MTQTMLAIARELQKAFNQEWIANTRKIILKTCEDMIPLLKV